MKKQFLLSLFSPGKDIDYSNFLLYLIYFYCILHYAQLVNRVYQENNCFINLYCYNISSNISSTKSVSTSTSSSRRSSVVVLMLFFFFFYFLFLLLLVQ